MAKVSRYTFLVVLMIFATIVLNQVVALAIPMPSPTYGFAAKWPDPASAGYFNYPYGVALDRDGNVYVADGNNSRIAKFNPSGVLLRTWGSPGSADGQLNVPVGITVDANGYVYVAEFNGDRIQKFTSNGAFVSKWGSSGTGNGQFNQPWSIALDAAGYVYVADYVNDRIQKFTASGTFVTKWGTTGTGIGQLDGPAGISIDSSGSVYVAEFTNNRVQKFTSSGSSLAMWGSHGTGDGQFNNPAGVAVSRGGNVVYVSDTQNNRIQKFYKRSAVDDANGDLLSDAIGFYDYGNSTTGYWVFRSGPAENPAGVSFSALNWGSTAGYNLGSAKTVSGDFNGDGKTDAIALYNGGGTTSTLKLFTSTGTSFNGPTTVFSSSAWSWANTKLVSGDFNADGKDELFAFYNYGGTNTGVYVFAQDATGVFSFRSVFYSPYWSWDKTRLLSVKTSTGAAKVVAAYNYGGTTTGLWTFELNADGTLKYPTQCFYSTQWAFANSSFTTGDIDGDKKTDVVVAYNYGGTTTGIFTFKATGLSGTNAFQYPVRSFFSTVWSFANSTFIPGDFNGDGRADCGAVYDYGAGKTALWVFASNGTSLANPAQIYNTPYWNNAATKWL